jgi:hypothetical protein
VAERGLPALSLDLGQRRGFVTNLIAQDSGWNVSFWFAVISPCSGLLLATIALAIFVLEKSNRGLPATAGRLRIKRIGRNLRFIRGIRVISGSTILQIFVKCRSSNA